MKKTVNKICLKRHGIITEEIYHLSVHFLTALMMPTLGTASSRENSCKDIASGEIPYPANDHIFTANNHIKQSNGVNKLEHENLQLVA